MSHGPFIIDYDDNTGLSIIEDHEGHRFFSQLGIAPKVDTVIYLNALSQDSWPNTTSFHTISGYPNGSVSYSVPQDKNLFLRFVCAAQTNAQKTEISHLGLYLNGNLKLIVPFISEISFGFPDPIMMLHGDTFEWKFRPYDTAAKLSLSTGGYLKVE